MEREATAIADVSNSVRLGRDFGRLNGMLDVKVPISPTKRARLLQSLFRLTTCDKLGLGMQAKGLKLATRLLKKRVPSMKLTFDWRILKARIEYVQFCDKESRGPLGAGKLVVAYRNALVKFTQKARKYFAEDAGREISKEIGNLTTCNDYVSFELLKAQGFLALLLPNHPGIDISQDQLDTWFHDWSRVSRSPDWDTNWFFIMDRVAKFSKSELKWSHLIPQIFSRILDTLCLPIGKAKNPRERSWDTSLQIFHPSTNMPSAKMSRAAKLVIRLLNTPETMPNLIKFLRTVRTFFHPSNTGKWSSPLGIFLGRLCTSLAKRVGSEAALLTPSTTKVDEKTLRSFLDAVFPLVFQALYSKSEVMIRSATQSLMAISSFAPSIVAEKCVPRFQNALDPSALNTSHQAPSVIRGLKWLVPTLLVPRSDGTVTSPLMLSCLPTFLRLTLPSIDPSDALKTMYGMAFYHSLLNTISIPDEDCSNKKDRDDFYHAPLDLFELKSEQDKKSKKQDDIEARAASALREWAPEFVRKVLVLFDSYSERSKSGGLNAQMDTTQSFMIIRAFKIFFQVTGPKTTLSMLTILRQNLLPSGGVRPLIHATSDVKALMACVSQVRPKETLETFLPHALKILLDEQCSNSMKLWCWSIVGGVLQNCGRDVLSYREELKRAFRDVFESKTHDFDKSVQKEAGKALRVLLRSIVNHYIIESSNPINISLLRSPLLASSFADREIRWHVTSEEEASFANELIQDHLLGPLSVLKSCIEDERKTQDENYHDSKLWIARLSQVRTCLRGILTVLHEDMFEMNHVPSLAKNLRLHVLEFTHEAAEYLLRYGSDDTKSSKLLVKIIQRILMDSGGSGRVKYGMRSSLMSHTRRSFNCTAVRAYHRTKLIEKASDNSSNKDHDEVALRATKRIDGHCGHCYPVPESIWLQRVELQYKGMLNDFAYRRPRVVFFGSDDDDDDDDYVDVDGKDESSSRKKRKKSKERQSTSSHKRWKDRAEACLEERAVDDLLLFAKHEYAAVRKKAQSAVTNTMKSRSWLIRPRILRLIRGLGQDGDVRSYEAARAVIHLLGDSVMSKRIVREPKLLTETVLCLSRGAPELMNALPKERKQKIREGLFAIFGVLLSSWRILDERHILRRSRSESQGESKDESPSPPLIVDKTGNTLSIAASTIEALLFSFSSSTKKVENEGDNNDDDDSNNWRRRMLTSSCVHLMGFNARGVQGGLFWRWWITCLHSEIVPIRNQAIAALQSLLGAFLSKDEIHKSKMPVLPEDVLQILGSESFCENLCLALAQDHTSGVRGADGRVQKSGKEQWSPGILQMVKTAKLVADRNSPSFPVTREKLVSSGKFVKSHARLVEAILRVTPQTSLHLVKQLPKLLSEIGEEKRNHQAAAAEIMSALLSRAREIRVLSLLLDTLRDTSVAYMAVWEDAVRYFVFRSIRDFETPDEVMLCLRKELTRRLENAFRSAQNGSEFSGASKWLRLIQAVFTEVVTMIDKKKSWRDFYVNMRDEYVSMCLVLDHPFKGGREELGRTLGQLCTLKPMFRDIALPTKSFQDALLPLHPMSSRKEQKEEEKDYVMVEKTDEAALSERQRKIETTLYWLYHTMNAGDTDDYAHLIPALLSIACDATRCGHLVTEGLAKHVLSVTPRNLRLLRHESPSRENVVKELEALCDEAKMPWHVRANALRFLGTFRVYHSFSLSDEQDRRLKLLCVRSLRDERPEVHDAAMTSLTGFLSSMDDDYVQKHVKKFIKDSSKRIPKKDVPEKRRMALNRRHGGLIGLTAVVRAFPYSMRSFLPDALVCLSNHLNDPAPLNKTAQKTLTEFKRTHQDTWSQIRDHFTEEQWEIMEDALVSPHYFA